VLLYLDMTMIDGGKAAWEAPALDPRMLKAFALIGVELMLITATAIFFSTFSSPFLSVALTFAVYIIGHFGEDLKNINTIVESTVLPYITKAVYYVMPNLSALDVKSAVVHGLPVSGTNMMLATVSSLLYIATLLVGSIVIFSRRDLK
jgi:Cu-processing system permease protein